MLFDLAGDIGETVGVALAAVGVLVGKVYGQKAEGRFNRLLKQGAWMVGLWVCAMLLVLLIWWGIASAG
jgi:Na+-driven multidrug efflux pump